MGRHYRGNDAVRPDPVKFWQWAVPALVLCGLSACSESQAPADADEQYSRLVTLAPNLTELVFAAGAGDALVGVSAYSDYPAAALSLPIIGDAFTVDQEKLALLEPDALLVWESGTPAHVVDQLRRVGFHVEVLRTRSLDDVANALIRIGELTGHDEEAAAEAMRYRSVLQSLRERYSDAPTIRVFYQVSRRPLFTINGDHFVSELIEICRGENIFADLDELAPTVDAEAIVARDPEVMLASDEAGDDAFAEWQRWPNIAANRYDNLFLLPADEIGRPTPRLLMAGEAVCQALTNARRQRAVAMEAAS